MPPLGQLPPGCPFAPRCPKRFEPCDKAVPGVTVVEGRVISVGVLGEVLVTELWHVSERGR